MKDYFVRVYAVFDICGNRLLRFGYSLCWCAWWMAREPWMMVPIVILVLAHTVYSIRMSRLRLYVGRRFVDEVKYVYPWKAIILALAPAYIIIGALLVVPWMSVRMALTACTILYMIAALIGGIIVKFAKREES